MCDNREDIIKEANAESLATVRWAAWQRVKTELLIMQRTFEASSDDKTCEELFRVSAVFISSVEGRCLHE